jgi:hypothetical protein
MAGAASAVSLPKVSRDTYRHVQAGRVTGRHGAVSARTELSSVATALVELAQRVTAIGDALTGEERDALSSDLFEVERALGNAARRLNRALDNR